MRTVGQHFCGVAWYNSTDVCPVDALLSENGLELSPRGRIDKVVLGGGSALVGNRGYMLEREVKRSN